MTFAESAACLAGFAGAVLGWPAEQFWQATPTELGAVVSVMAGDVVAPPDGATIARLREAFPDG